VANDPARIVAGMAASSHRTERNLELIDTSLQAKLLSVTGRWPVTSGRPGAAGSGRGTLHPQPLRETLRVERGVHFRVIIEVDVRVSRTAPPPASDARCPIVQLVFAVAADIELRGPMKPHVGEVCGEHIGVPELARGISKDERAPVRCEHVIEFLAEVRRVAYLERVSIAHPTTYRIDQCSAFESMIVLARDCLSRDGITGQQTHELVESLRPEAIRRRQLPEERARPLTEREHTTRKEIPECAVAVSELQIVRDESASFDGEHKVALRHRISPALEHGR